jgi:hypothetical protein
MNLDQVVPVDDSPADWEDVLRRARRFPRRRFLLAAALAVAALGGGPALGVMLTRDTAPQLPAGADRSRVALVSQPLTGRMLLKAAPWTDHAGFCYAAYFVFSGKKSGCVSQTQTGSGFVSPLAGYTFDRRVVSVTAQRSLRRGARVVLRRLPDLGVTFFYVRGRLPGLLFRVELHDAAGRTLKTIRFRPR